MRPLVRALMTLPGVAELGEIKRFAHPRELMGYLGLVQATLMPALVDRGGLELSLSGSHQPMSAKAPGRPTRADP